MCNTLFKIVIRASGTLLNINVIRTTNSLLKICTFKYIYKRLFKNLIFDYTYAFLDLFMFSRRFMPFN